MKLLKLTPMIIALAACWLAACEPVLAQQPSAETHIVQSDVNGCELNSLHIDVMANEERNSSERIFVIARLGRGEVSRRLNRGRLESVRLYLSDKGLNRERMVFAEGDRVDGEGRIEFYIGSRLYLVSLAKRGKCVCLTCCEDYVVPQRSKRKGRT